MEHCPEVPFLPASHHGGYEYDGTQLRTRSSFLSLSRLSLFYLARGVNWGGRDKGQWDSRRASWGQCGRKNQNRLPRRYISFEPFKPTSSSSSCLHFRWTPKSQTRRTRVFDGRSLTVPICQIWWLRCVCSGKNPRKKTSQEKGATKGDSLLPPPPAPLTFPTHLCSPKSKETEMEEEEKRNGRPAPLKPWAWQVQSHLFLTASHTPSLFPRRRRERARKRERKRFYIKSTADYLLIKISTERITNERQGRKLEEKTKQNKSGFFFFSSCMAY